MLDMKTQMKMELTRNTNRQSSSSAVVALFVKIQLVQLQLFGIEAFGETERLAYGPLTIKHLHSSLQTETQNSLHLNVNI